ncbi:ATP-binding protein [Salarchaeum sp. III]|uniref:ATP-binding protein n=1 Tax=Salarchaeum sp. III TaxID=3107927 RepID=UPI002ED83ECD
MLGDGAQKEVLVKRYRERRSMADRARETGNGERARRRYEECARLLDAIADLEGSEEMAAERRSLAENLRTAADQVTDRSDGSTDRSTGSEPIDGDADTADAGRFLSDPPSLAFDDVGGMAALKDRLRERVVEPLSNPELYETYDLGVVNGVLLYGPPGTGKTYVTRALAGELGYNVVEVTPADVTSSLVGEAADNVAAVFETARANQPCLVFIDEVDAVAGARSDGARATQSERQMVNQLLTELSEIQGEDVVVVAATNLLDAVDDAITRSGRFDERIEVSPPDAAAREAILRVHLRDRPVADDADVPAIAADTEGYVASDMELLAATAARFALADARESGRVEEITDAHLRAALDDVDPSLS